MTLPRRRLNHGAWGVALRSLGLPAALVACAGAPSNDAPPAPSPPPDPQSAAQAEPVLTVATGEPNHDDLRALAAANLQEARVCLAKVDRDAITDAEMDRITIAQGLVDAADRALTQDRVQEGAQLADKALTIARDLKPKL